MTKGEKPPASIKSRGESVWQRALRRFRRHRLAMFSVVVLTVILVLAIGAPIFEGYPPNNIQLSQSNKPPSAEHLLGTDRIGRDIWSRMINGGQVSLAIGIFSAALSMVLGVLVGALSGFYGGWIDTVLQRITDMFMTFPSIVLMMTAALFIGPGVINTILIIGAVSWMGVARLIRAEFLSARERVYVEAARCIGVRDAGIIFTHILPNALTPALAQIAFAVGLAILTEAGLSFLGLGVPLPTSSWGNMLETAREIEVLRASPWMWMPPAVMILLTVLCVNFIGDGLRDALDPHTLL
jgi:peptide/nickel transport system permease protein